MPIYTQCLFCKHYLGGHECLAFPDQIPDEIWTGKFDHSKPWPDEKEPKDGGIIRVSFLSKRQENRLPQKALQTALQ